MNVRLEPFPETPSCTWIHADEPYEVQMHKCSSMHLPRTSWLGDSHSRG